MSLYPSLEDLKVDELARSQIEAMQRQQGHMTAPAPTAPAYAQAPPYPTGEMERKYSSLYPALDDYMGMELTSDEIALNYAVAVPAPSAVVVSGKSPGSMQMVAPLSGGSLGLQRAQVTHGVRELVVCKDQNGKVGMRVKDVCKGVFVVFVQVGTPAALAGLRFGDQILQINEVVVAGFSMDKVHNLIRKVSGDRITLIVRDRPFERTVTMHKDSVGHIGFAFKEGKITSIVKDSSAARNGLLIDHNLLEVNGQNVVGMPDKDVGRLIDAGGNVITITIMPSFMYNHIIKQMAGSLVKKLMDHSIPDI